MMQNLLSQEISRESISKAIDQLIRRYLDLPEVDRTAMSEQGVRDYFVTPLLEALGWGTLDPRERLAEKHLPHKGFSDYELCLPGTDTKDPYVPVLYVEAKKFGELSALQPDLFGYERRSEADRQVMAYADAYNPRRGEKIGWALLTNFEFFRLWDTRRNVLVESTEWFNELKRERTLEILYRLSRNEVARDPSLYSLRSYRKLPDIDENFLAKLNEWRAKLAHSIWKQKSNRPTLGQSLPEQEANLREVVQRTLDRLIVIRTAEDRGLLPPPLRLQEMVRNFGGQNSVPLMLLENIQRNTFGYFDHRYNSKLFGKHLADKMEVHNTPLAQVIEQLCKVSFDSMNADLLGATYEQYLGQTIEIDVPADVPNLVPNLETRHAQGSYYTPRYVVQYIVDHSVGRYLYGTDNGQPAGKIVPGARRKTLLEIQNLTIVDPACGSGSFLIYAFDVLFDFYSAEKQRIEAEIDQKLDAIVASGVPRLAAEANHDPAILSLRTELSRTRFAHAQIIERHLYGVDLDPQAAEVASMNLLLKALTRDERLPRILGDNVKTGNSLISGLNLEDVPDPLKGELESLREIRRQIHQNTLLASENDESRANYEEVIEELERQFRSRADALNQVVNVPLRKTDDNGWFDNLEPKRPFNWQVEFPEIFCRTDDSHPKFTFVLGNPPYVGFHGFSEDKPFLRDTYLTASGKFDIFVPFIERGLTLTSEDGSLSFICPSTFMKRAFGRKLRHFILKSASLESLHDFLHTKVFREALNYTCIPKFRKSKPDASHGVAYSEGPSIGESARLFLQSKLTESPWVFRFGQDETLVEKVRSNPSCRTLGSPDVSHGVSEGIVTASNSVLLIHMKDVERLGLEEDFLRRCIRGEDVKRYSLVWGGFYVFYPYQLQGEDTAVVPEGVLKDKCPALYKYLLDRRSQLESRTYLKGTAKKWYELWCQRDMRLQQAEKIIVPELADRSQFAQATANYFYVDTTCGIALKATSQTDVWYVLACLNSRIGEYLYRKTTVPKANGFLIYKTMYLKPFPIPLPQSSEQWELAARISQLAKAIQQANSKLAALEKEFESHIDSTLPVMDSSKANFFRDYYSVQQFWGNRKLIPEGALQLTDAVASIRVDNATVSAHNGSSATDKLIISYRSERNGPWKPLVELQLTDEDLRLFLLFALRRFISENSRKKSWKIAHLNRTVDVVLQSLIVPVWGLPFGTGGAETNLAKIRELMSSFRTVQGEVDPSLIERDRDALDAEIDALFFELYGLNQSERDLVLTTVIR